MLPTILNFEMKKYNQYFLIFILIAQVVACVKPYEPAPVKADNNYLVVDGLINASPNSETTVTLSRTKNLGDTVLFHPELNAAVFIEAENGGNYILQQKPNGIYSISNLTLNNNEKYRLKIFTTDGREHVSDYVPVKISPPVDSVTWRQDGDVTVYVHSHDAANNTKYYRWEYKETWEYHSPYETDMYVRNRYIYFADSNFQVYKCWDSAYSLDIVTKSTINLSQDVVSNHPVAVVPKNSAKIGVRYSVLVKQYAITEEAHQFWEILKKNTEQLGTLFDPQPSQLKGNIKCISNPSEPVIGFVSASSVSEKRIFIDSSEVKDWVAYQSGSICQTITIGLNASDYRIFDFPDTNYSPYYFVTGGMVLLKVPCLICTTRGGTNFKPSYWR